MFTVSNKKFYPPLTERSRSKAVVISRILASLFVCVSLSLAGPSAAQDKPYKEGTIWGVSFIKIKPGMFDVYMRDLANQRKPLMDEAKKAGLIVSEKMLSGQSFGKEDWDLMLMVEYKNWAAFDGLSAKFDALALKIVGSEEKQLQTMIKRTEVREIVGEKTFQEVSFK